MAAVLRYSTGVESDNRLAIARVAAAGRVAAERRNLRLRQEAHEETCDCRREYDYCENYPN